MGSVNSVRLEGSGADQTEGAGRAEAVMPCPFCGSPQAADIEIDSGMWAVCCYGCGTIGPHGRTSQRALARWNAPLERPTFPSAGSVGVNRILPMTDRAVSSEQSESSP